MYHSRDELPVERRPRSALTENHGFGDIVHQGRAPIGRDRVALDCPAQNLFEWRKLVVRHAHLQQRVQLLLVTGGGDEIVDYRHLRCCRLPAHCPHNRYGVGAQPAGIGNRLAVLSIERIECRFHQFGFVAPTAIHRGLARMRARSDAVHCDRLVACSWSS
jgi:hypothetical protein